MASNVFLVVFRLIHSAIRRILFFSQDLGVYSYFVSFCFVKIVCFVLTFFCWTHFHRSSFPILSFLCPYLPTLARFLKTPSSVFFQSFSSLFFALTTLVYLRLLLYIQHVRIDRTPATCPLDEPNSKPERFQLIIGFKAFA